MRFTERIAELEREREPFAVATVVARLAPVSSHLGDRAIVFADGRMEGFVGGACSRDIVRRHARAALNSHKPLLLRVRPAGSGSEAAPETSDDVVDVPMGCTSEGAVDIFVEPHVPRPHFLIAGFTPVADVLARVAATLDYVVERFVSHEELPDVPDVEGVDVHEIGALPIFLDAFEPAARARSVAVVASQGHYDEIALAGLLKAHLAFVGLVASRKRGAGVRDVLAQEGVSEAQLATLRSPVGLDIGARTPGDVAVSILAEIVALPASEAAPETETGAPGHEALDPVCGMTVAIHETHHRAEHDGRTYFFCCAHCRATFVASPERYAIAAAP